MAASKQPVLCMQATICRYARCFRRSRPFSWPVRGSQREEVHRDLIPTRDDPTLRKASKALIIRDSGTRRKVGVKTVGMTTRIRPGGRSADWSSSGEPAAVRMERRKAHHRRIASRVRIWLPPGSELGLWPCRLRDREAVLQHLEARDLPFGNGENECKRRLDDLSC